MQFSEINRKLEAKKHTTLHYIKRIAFSGVWLTGVLLLIQIFFLAEIFVRLGQDSPYLLELFGLVSRGL